MVRGALQRSAAWLAGFVLLVVTVAPLNAQAQTVPVQIPSSNLDTGPMPQSSAALVDTSWQLQSFNNGQGAVATPIPGTEVTAQFGSDGSIFGSAGCNSYRGEYTLDGNSLTVGVLATTLMACLPPVDQQETAFLTALQATATWSLTNGVLTLFDANGAIQTTFTAPVTPAGGPLAPGVEWRIQSYNNGKGGVVTVLPDAVATATFEDSGMVSGNTGCNGFLGSYTTEGTSISFGPLATTRRACPSDASSAQEQAIIAAFGASASFEVVGERTTLRSADGATQLVLLRPSIQPTPG